MRGFNAESEYQCSLSFRKSLNAVQYSRLYCNALDNPEPSGPGKPEQSSRRGALSLVMQRSHYAFIDGAAVKSRGFGVQSHTEP